MQLKFLGTGGGRYVTAKQIRKTAGIILETNETRLHIDPGPGALYLNHQMTENPMETEAVILSHAHLDHGNDAQAIIEQMTEGADKKGVLFANKTSLQGYGDTEKMISKYHQNLCGRVETLKEDSEHDFKDLKIRSQEMFHSDPLTAGFTIENNEKKIGFWTDTEYSDELTSFYNNCDTLIIYCTRPKNKSAPQHTSIDDIPKINESISADNIIITHYGYQMLKEGIEPQKEWLEEKIDSNIIFAEDGMDFPGNKSLQDF